mmetsp:Transcript_29046/g.63087  ORF Transcript_29046/g.63087 Transcript_29046/m.63087 type:complete len:86 (+) Transcript_29046:1-258(+)
MMKWDVQTLQEQQIDVGRVRLENGQSVWVAQAPRSNRLLYVMKKRDLRSISCIVGEAKAPAPTRDDEEDEPSTYGDDYTKIQLIP